MATITKSQLATENAALRSRISELEGLLQRERAARAALPTKQRPKFIISPEEEARRADIRARMAAAREEAIRTGRTVKV